MLHPGMQPILWKYGYADILHEEFLQNSMQNIDETKE